MISIYMYAIRKINYIFMILLLLEAREKFLFKHVRVRRIEFVELRNVNISRRIEKQV